MTTLSVKQASGFSQTNGVFGFVQKIEKKLAQRSAYKRTVAELTRLNERELADLGLAYGDIHHIARQAADLV